MNKKSKQKLESKNKSNKIKKCKFDIIDYKKNYKKLMIIPVIMFILATISIISTIHKESSPIYRDVTLKGGLSATFYTENKISTPEFEKLIKDNFKDNSFKISEIHENGQRTGFIIDTDLKEKDLIEFLQLKFKEKITESENFISSYISPSLSESFFTQAMYILSISFVLMSAVIFLYFRQLVPSGAVVLSAIFDIIVTVGILDFLKSEVSISGIGALLMLIGYSIDTDVLLTNRLIRESGDNYFEKAFQAFKTGSLMSLTTLIAGFAALILTNSGIIYEITLILVIGLIVDFISTWFQNSGILLWWIEKKNN